jgi:hypothetical protein
VADKYVNAVSSFPRRCDIRVSHKLIHIRVAERKFRGRVA